MRRVATVKTEDEKNFLLEAMWLMQHSSKLDPFDNVIAILSRGCEGIDAVLGDTNDQNRFFLALAGLQRLAEELRIPIAIVGGLGAIRYGYPAATQDIDIAIAAEDLDRLILAAPRFGFKVVWESKLGWHTITHGDVEINIVPEGGKARDSSPTTIPHPRQMGVSEGLQYAGLPSWVELKISSDRQKDRAHIVEVLKKTSSPEIDHVRNHLASVHSDYVVRFDALVVQAIEENQQESDRR